MLACFVCLRPRESRLRRLATRAFVNLVIPAHRAYGRGGEERFVYLPAPRWSSQAVSGRAGAHRKPHIVLRPAQAAAERNEGRFV